MKTNNGSRRKRGLYARTQHVTGAPARSGRGGSEEGEDAMADAVRIEFLAHESVCSGLPHPVPASRAVPEWFKHMPMNRTPEPATGFDGRTAKMCMPFLEAMTAGYVILLPCDVHLEMLAPGKLRYQSEFGIAGAHAPGQSEGTPFMNMPVLKFINPWVIRTPPGYSTLFTAPLNRHDTPVTPLSGLVETDTYYREVHIPSVVHMPPGSSFTMKAGTPLVQVIPVRRETWTSEVKPMDVPQRAATEEKFNQNIHAYREEYWVKKNTT